MARTLSPNEVTAALRSLDKALQLVAWAAGIAATQLEQLNGHTPSKTTKPAAAPSKGKRSGK